MNIMIANRLVELRKKNGYSQEALAEKLGLSRQAVSKWERAEASPDTDNLISLAKLYNISLDELLSTDEKEEDIAKATKEKEEEKGKESPRKGSSYINDDGIYIQDNDGSSISISSDGIYMKDGDDALNISSKFLKEREDDPFLNEKSEKTEAYICTISFAIISISYILLGSFLEGGWALYWPLFFFAPLFSSLYAAIKKRSFCSFLYPLLLTGVYCFLGSALSLWHPYWFLFLTIPLYYIIFSPLDEYIRKKRD